MIVDLNQVLITAAWNNDVEQAANLIDLGADVNAKDDTVQSAYLIATSEGYVELLNLTLEHGADLAAKDSYNGTGLIRAADRGHAEVIAILLRNGVEVNHINRLGWTALHEAIILGNGDDRYIDCVRLLLAAGADPLLPSQVDGISPEDHARSRGFETIATTIRRVIDGESVTEPTTALDAFIQAGDADGVVLALRTGGFTLAQESRSEATLSTNADCARLLALLAP